MYGYGYRYNSGLVVGAGGGGFTNTYSLSFDGVDDYVDCGNISELNGVTEATWSIWAAKGDTTDDYLMSCYSATGSLQQYLFHQYSDKLYIYLSNSGGTLRLMNRIDYTFNIDEWYHIGIVYNEAEVSNADKVKVYINGVLQINQVAGFALTSLRSTTASTNIARATDFTTKEYNGNIDEVAIFNSAISIGDVWDGSGQPTDLSLLATPPIAWYRMGDNGSWKSPQWLLPNNENKDKVSNYSFEFDGIDDYITASNAVLSSAGDMTISCWANFTSLSSVQGIFDSTNYFLSGFNGGFSFRTIGANLDVAFSNGTSFDAHSATAGLSTSGGWYHLAFTFDNTTKVGTFYKNGASIGTHTYTGFDNADLTNGGVIGRSVRNNNFCFTGLLDEIVIFDSVKDATAINDIYNSGEPTTLPSGAVAHYKLGEEATFSGGVWTVPDAVGSNNGTSNAMTIEDRVGKAPNSENNALSYNMDEVDRVTDTP